MDNMDRIYMQQAIDLAKTGTGFVNPNPQVGAVIVKDGRIIGQGAHLKCGQLHAERNALAACSEDPSGATIYVTLEPCCHHGKQPPCTDALIESGIKRVLVGSRDPNPEVSGKGVEILRQHGIEVIEDFMMEECDELNPIFFHYITTGLPYVALKYAMTLDGKIATRTGASKWITSDTAREHVHTLRGRYAVIMAGIGTVLADDPLLNCRAEGGHQPVRVICDSRLQIPVDSQICRTAGEYRTIIACAVNDEDRIFRIESCGAEVWVLPKDGKDSPKVDLKALVERLGKEKLDSILVEGGGILHEALLSEGLADHLYAYVAPKLFGGADAKSPVEGQGVALPAEAALLSDLKIQSLGPDILIEGNISNGFLKE